MMTNAICHRLDYNWLIMFNDIFTRSFRCIVNSKHISSIDTYRCNAVARRASACYSISFILFTAWRRNCKSIVSTNKIRIIMSCYLRHSHWLFLFWFLFVILLFTHQNRMIGHDSVAAKLNAA